MVPRRHVIPRLNLGMVVRDASSSAGGVDVGFCRPLSLWGICQGHGGWQGRGLASLGRVEKTCDVA